METRRRVATRLGRSDSAPSHRLLEDGNRETYNTDRINSVEDSLAELDDRLGQVNERLDRVLDGIQLMSRVVERNQEMANQNAEVVGQVQAFAEHTATTINHTAAALTELQQNAASVQQVREMAARVATAVSEMQHQQASAPSEYQPSQPSQPSQNSPAPTAPRASFPYQAEDVEMAGTTRGRQLRKMDSKPPTFDGDIDGVKLNSFLFQFEAYFTFKGYDLEVDGVTVGLELGQCVRKSAITWYETYMQRHDTLKTWSAMKHSLERNFKEPNFQQKMRTALLNIKQRGSYHGYAAKFQEQLRLVPLESTFAKEIFLKGLSSANLRKQILRKNPGTVEEAIAEGFAEEALEDEAKGAPADLPRRSHDHEGRGRQERKPKASRMQTSPKSKCSHCQRGFHNPDDCWVKFSEKRPVKATSDKKAKFPRRDPTNAVDYKAKYYALIEKLMVDEDVETPSSLNE